MSRTSANANNVNANNVNDSSANAESIRDQLPLDLNAHDFVGPYLFPDNSRRRILAAIMIVGGLASIVVAGLAGSDAVYANRGLIGGGVVLVLMGAWILISAARIIFREIDALTVVGKQIDFVLGPASAQLGWRGFLSRPTWRILCFDDNSPPRHHCFAMVDALDGRVIELITQDADADIHLSDVAELKSIDLRSDKDDQPHHKDGSSAEFATKAHNRD